MSAARFTRSGVLAAPVLLTQERCQLTGIRAVVVNAGNANAATGRRGLEDAARMQGAGAMAAGVLEDRVAVASTGVIGVPLDTDKVIRGIADARRELAADGDGASARRSAPPTRSPRTPRSRSRCRRAPCGCARRPRARG